jgi:hypothetical protein
MSAGRPSSTVRGGLSSGGRGRFVTGRVRAGEMGATCCVLYLGPRKREKVMGRELREEQRWVSVVDARRWTRRGGAAQEHRSSRRAR